MNNQQFLLPGDYFFGEFSGRIVTLLGSCVAVTLWHPQRRLAAVSHFLLPRGQRFDMQDTHYGEAVFTQLIQDMRRWGTQPGEYRKGLFGGGSQIAPKPGSGLQVAASNVRFAHEQFQRLGWRIDQEQLGGRVYRRLSLDASDGRILCQPLSSHPLAREPA